MIVKSLAIPPALEMCPILLKRGVVLLQKIKFKRTPQHDIITSQSSLDIEYFTTDHTFYGSCKMES